MLSISYIDFVISHEPHPVGTATFLRFPLSDVSDTSIKSAASAVIVVLFVITVLSTESVVAPVTSQV